MEIARLTSPCPPYTGERAELCHGVVEFVAPPEYQARPPRPPPIVCLIETSYAAVAGGIFHAVTTALAAIVPSLPPHTEFAIVTFDDGVHFFNVRPDGVVDHMSVPDNTEVCLPRPPSQLLMRLGDSQERVHQLLGALPKLATMSKRADTALGSALQACHLLLEGTGGRLLFFQHVLPVLGPMKLQQRDDVRLYGTDKERALFAPLDTEWEELGKKMASKYISVSSFHFVTQSFTDVASCAILSRMTGGQLYLYQNCVPEQQDLWATKLEVELGRNLHRSFGFEGVMRFRCSKGLCVDQYLMGMSKPGDIEVDVPSIDADYAFAVTLRHDEKLEDNAPAFVQCALLYTTAAGERRVRVLTLGLTTTSVMSSLYRYADLDTLLNVTLRQAVALSAKQNMHQVREWVVNNTVKILYTYRKMCTQSNAQAGQLILPESFKLLPLYALSLTKNGVLRAGTDVRADERSALMAQVGRMPLTSSVAFIYPRLFSMRNLDEFVGALDADGSPQLPSALPLSILQETAASRGGKKVRIEESDDAFLIEDSIGIHIFLGGSVPPEFLESVLQINTLAGVDCSQLRIHPLQNDDSIRVNRLINGVSGRGSNAARCCYECRPCVLSFPASVPHAFMGASVVCHFSCLADSLPAAASVPEHSRPRVEGSVRGPLPQHADGGSRADIHGVHRVPLPCPSADPTEVCLLAWNSRAGKVQTRAGSSCEVGCVLARRACEVEVPAEEMPAALCTKGLFGRCESGVDTCSGAWAGRRVAQRAMHQRAFRIARLVRGAPCAWHAFCMSGRRREVAGSTDFLQLANARAPKQGNADRACGGEVECPLLRSVRVGLAHGDAGL